MIKRRLFSLLLCGLYVFAFTACRGPNEALASSQEESPSAAISSEVSSKDSGTPSSAPVSSQVSAVEPSSALEATPPASSKEPASSAVPAQEKLEKAPQMPASSQSAALDKQKSIPSSQEAPPSSETVSSQATATGPAHCTGVAGSVEQTLFQKINDKRVELGLVALAWDDAYHAAANIRSNELPTLYEHLRPDGRDWSTIFTELGLPTYPGRENLIYAGNAAIALNEDQVAAELYTGWITSQGHYENLTASDVNVSGLCVLYTDTDVYATQLFGHK